MNTLSEVIGKGLETILEAISESEEPLNEMVMNMNMTVDNNKDANVKLHYNNDKIDVTVTVDGEEAISSSMDLTEEML